jgi:hypothetical protein
MPTAPNATTVTAGVTLVTTAETAVATTVARAVNAPGSQGQIVSGMVNITEGTAGTGGTIRVRAGNGTGGALIGVAQPYTLAAAASDSFPFAVIDPTVSGTVQYTVTVQQTAATGNGTVNTTTVSEQTANAAGA